MNRRIAPRHALPTLVVSVGCPAGVGPEVSVLAATRLKSARVVLVGDEDTISNAAELVGVKENQLHSRRISVLHAGPELGLADRRPGRPSQRSGAAQLAYVDAALELVKRGEASALVTGPVSKAAIAASGAPRSRSFRGHTEYLEQRDGAAYSVMCFAAKRLSCSLVTTHLPLARVPRAISAGAVCRASLELCRLLQRSGVKHPHVAVASLNPHAGESELLGGEERRAIVPGMQAAQKLLGRGAKLEGPVGAETAFRRAAAGGYHGVVAMYHDQATIPMKLLAFGDAVNVTMGLSFVRTSVDHGTAYDIAWQGKADPDGMLAAMELAKRLSR